MQGASFIPKYSLMQCKEPLSFPNIPWCNARNLFHSLIFLDAMQGASFNPKYSLMQCKELRSCLHNPWLNPYLIVLAVSCRTCFNRKYLWRNNSTKHFWVLIFLSICNCSSKSTQVWSAYKVLCEKFSTYLDFPSSEISGKQLLRKRIGKQIRIF